MPIVEWQKLPRAETVQIKQLGNGITLVHSIQQGMVYRWTSLHDTIQRMLAGYGLED